jgi:phosphomannomutase
LCKQEPGADLVLANDPDGDRCAVALPTADGMRMLTGDETGALLAAHLIARGETGTFATSIVSSSLLGKMAARRGLTYAETLTGFKWLTRPAGLRYAYEEALGYCVDPDAVRDKDGITAALLVADLAAQCRRRGRTLLDELDDLAREYGLHATDQLSIRVEDAKAVAGLLDALRRRPPAALGGLAVQRVDDLSVGADGLPPTPGVRYFLAGGARVIFRPSGTEPKLKCYLEAVVPVTGDLAAARSDAARRLAAVKIDLQSRVDVRG